MKENKFTQIVSKSIKEFKHYSPEIAGGMALAGLGLTIWQTIKATKKAEKIISKEKKELSTKEKVKLTWKCYIPAATSAAMTASCIIFSTKKNFEKKAALMTAYKISETALNDYKQSVQETCGEKQMQAITDKVNQMKVNRTPLDEKNNRVVVKAGDRLCMDYYTGQYFMSNADKIRTAVNELNDKLNPSYKYGAWSSVSLSDFLDLVGGKPTEVTNNLVWKAENGSIKLSGFTSAVAPNDEACLIPIFEQNPEYDEGY